MPLRVCGNELIDCGARRWLTRAVRLTAGLLGCWFFQASAADEGKNDPSTPYAVAIHQIEGRLQWRENEAVSLAGELERLGDFGKSDLRLLKPDYDRLIVPATKAIAAYQRGDAATARPLARETESFQPDRDWRRRVGARERQAELWPTEEWAYTLATRTGGARARAYAPQWIEARRKASLAWARVADAVAPATEVDRVTMLEDEAYAAQAEVKTAETIWQLCETLDDRVPDKRISSPRLVELVKSFEQLGQEIAAIDRARAELEQRQRQWSRTRQRLDHQIQRAYYEAQQAEAAARKAAHRKP